MFKKNRIYQQYATKVFLTSSHFEQTQIKFFPDSPLFDMNTGKSKLKGIFLRNKGYTIVTCLGPYLKYNIAFFPQEIVNYLFWQFRSNFAFTAFMNIMMLLLRDNTDCLFSKQIQIIDYGSCSLHCVFDCIFISQCHACFPSEED